MLAVVLALGSSLCWGTADFFGGLQSRRRSLVTVLLFAQGTAVVLAVAYAATASDAVPSLAAVGWAAGAGLAGCAALAAFYRGLAIGTMSIVAPVSATGAVVPVLVGVAGGERPSALQVAGIAVAMVGIVLASREPGTAVPSRAARASIGLALVAALGFGAFFVGIERATDSAGVAWTILVARGSQLAALAVVAAALRPALPVSVRDAAPLLLIGFLDLLANVLFAFATTQGLLSVVAVVGSLYPAITVILARAVLHERVSGVQGAGVVATLAGVVAISAG